MSAPAAPAAAQQSPPLPLTSAPLQLVRSATPPVVSGDILSFIFSTLFGCLPRLGERELCDLAALGFDELHVARAGYRSAPGVEYFKQAKGKTGKREIVKLVIESELNSARYFKHIFCNGLRAPGFYFDGQLMRLNLQPDRLVAPVRDVRARIVGLHTYRTVHDALPQWFESVGLPRGARARRSAHFARPHLARTSGGIVIAEHTLSADLHAWQHDEAAVAVNDLLPDVFARALRESLPTVSVVAFAFPLPDLDLLRALSLHGFEVHGEAAQEVV